MTKAPPMLKAKRGQKLAKVITIGPCGDVACQVTVTGVRNRGQTILIEGETDESAGVNAYNALTGQALVDYIPNCSSKLMTIKAARKAGIDFEDDDD